MGNTAIVLLRKDYSTKRKKKSLFQSVDNVQLIGILIDHLNLESYKNENAVRRQLPQEILVLQFISKDRKCRCFKLSART